MRVKVYYNKDLKMSSGKLAAQVGHAVSGLYGVHGIIYNSLDTVVVLKLSSKKFTEKTSEIINDDVESYLQIDRGLTEVDSGTATAIAYVENW